MRRRRPPRGARWLGSPAALVSVVLIGDGATGHNHGGRTCERTTLPEPIWKGCQVLVTVVDIFANDTNKLLEVKI